MQALSHRSLICNINDDKILPETLNTMKGVRLQMAEMVGRDAINLETIGKSMKKKKQKHEGN